MKFRDSDGQVGHQVIEGRDFYISYIPSSKIGVLSFLDGDNDGGPETAIKIDSGWGVLNGDFRTEFEAAADKGKDAVLAVFKSHPESRSSWSQL